MAVWKETEARVMRKTISLTILEEKLAEEDTLESLKTQIDLYYSGDEVMDFDNL